MRRGILIAALAATFAVPGLAKGDSFISGNMLLTRCEQRSAFCAGYVASVADGLDSAQATNSGPVAGWRACLPRGIVLQQADDIALNFLYRHPELRQKSAFSLIAHALAEAFPCR